MMLFSENINLFNRSAQPNRQTDCQDYYGNNALCTIVHRVVKIATYYIGFRSPIRKGSAFQVSYKNALYKSTVIIINGGRKGQPIVKTFCCYLCKNG